MNPQDAYRQNDILHKTGRALEASALTNMANKLLYIQNNWSTLVTDGILERELKIVLDQNLYLWTILQTELVDENNPLPQKLKGDILSISVYVNKRTFEIYTNTNNKELLDVLIFINQKLAEGLRSHD